MKNILVTFSVAVVTFVGFGRADYCQMKCNGTVHYACKHVEVTKLVQQTQLGDVKCRVSGRTSPDKRSEIMAAVNSFRNEVATGAGANVSSSNMGQLSWDYTLERFARILSSNVFNDVGVDYKSGSVWLGKACVPTEHMSKTTAIAFILLNGDMGFPTMETVMRAWTGPQSIPQPALIDNFQSQSSMAMFVDPKSFTWTALACASASKLGCTFTELSCTKPTEEGDTYQVSVTCVIGDGCNSVGQPVYSKGEPCKSCPSDTACNKGSHWKNLCASKNDMIAPMSIPDSAHLAHLEPSLSSSVILIFSWYTLVN